MGFNDEFLQTSCVIVGRLPGRPQFLPESRENSSCDKISTINACICSNSPLPLPIKEVVVHKFLLLQEEQGPDLGVELRRTFFSRRTERTGWTVMGKGNR